MDRKLIDYLPEFMQEYKEIREILDKEQKQTEILWKAADSLLSEAFIQDASEHGVSRWESVLDIQPKDQDSLEVRRFRVTGRLNEDLPYTMRTFKRQLTALCGKDGYTTELQSEKYTLKVVVALTSKALLEEVKVLAERVVPLNLILEISLMYNTHEMLKPATHGFLNNYMHDAVRKTVFE